MLGGGIWGQQGKNNCSRRGNLGCVLGVVIQGDLCCGGSGERGFVLGGIWRVCARRDDMVEGGGDLC